MESVCLTLGLGVYDKQHLCGVFAWGFMIGHDPYAVVVFNFPGDHTFDRAFEDFGFLGHYRPDRRLEFLLVLAHAYVQIFCVENCPFWDAFSRHNSPVVGGDFLGSEEFPDACDVIRDRKASSGVAREEAEELLSCEGGGRYAPGWRSFRLGG